MAAKGNVLNFIISRSRFQHSLDRDLPRNIGAEDSADFLQIVGLAESPHELGDSGLSGHVQTGDDAEGHDLAADLVDRDIAALV